MYGQQKRKRFHIMRGLFRLWIVAAAFWVLPISFAFWSGNGGAGAQWVWSEPEPERTSVGGPQPFRNGFISDQEALASVAAANRGNEKGISWDEFKNSPGPPIIMSLQFPTFLLLAFGPPGIALAFGASVAWAIKGFQT